MIGKTIWIVFSRYGGVIELFLSKEVIGFKVILQKDQFDRFEEEKWKGREIEVKGIIKRLLRQVKERVDFLMMWK